MKCKIIGCSLLAVLFAGCATLQQRAVVTENTIENPALGFFGFKYEVPEGFELYRSPAESAGDYNEIQRLGLRVHELNLDYHPRGEEAFYEEFLIFSENVAFVLVTLTHVSAPSLEWYDTKVNLAPQAQLLPLYNVEKSDHVALGDNRLDAFFAKGTAYESKGWYYSKPKAARVPFSYEACKVQGQNRDRYILMGFSLPEHEHILSLQMQEMVRGFRF